MTSEGLFSGVYGSQSSTINDLAGPNPNNPDDIWYAAWNGNASVETGSVLPGAYQNHQRIHQYHGDTTQSFGGVALDIDLDFADGRADGVIMKRFSLSGLAIEMNIRRFVIAGRT